MGGSSHQAVAKSRAGFTLAEILIAMLVFSIAITTILALLARSIETVDEIILKDEAMRLSDAVEEHMSDLSFNQAYQLVENQQPLHAFHYRVNPDGTPRADHTGTPGEDYYVEPFVESQVEESAYRARDGRYFQVRLRESETNPVEMTSNPDMYPSAVFVVFAEFFPLANPSMDIGPNIRDVYSYNFGVRR